MQPKTRNRIAGVMLAVLFAFMAVSMAPSQAMAANNTDNVSYTLASASDYSSEVSSTGWRCSASAKVSISGPKWLLKGHVNGNSFKLPSKDDKGNDVSGWKFAYSRGSIVLKPGTTYSGYASAQVDYCVPDIHSGGVSEDSKLESSGEVVVRLIAEYLELSYQGPADVTPPSITGVGDKTIAIGDQFDPMQGVAATDDIDGDLTSSIKVTGTVDTSKPGAYELTYTVSDQAGNEASVKRTITVNPVMSASMPETGMGGLAYPLIAASATLMAVVMSFLARVARRKEAAGR